MENKRFSIFCVLIFQLLISSVQAQTLYVRQTNGSQRNQELSDLRKMTYSSGVVTVQKNDNTTLGYPINTIRYQSFKDFITGTMTDVRDQLEYKWVIIGNQTWMAENLKYLPNVAGPITGSTTTPYYYVYGYDGTDVSDAKATQNYSTYGVLYNWPAVMAGSPSSSTNPSGIQGVCPEGWHLPSELEWQILETYLAENGFNFDTTISDSSDKIAKSMANSTGWRNSDETGTLGSLDYVTQRNYSGFSALPSGNRGHGAPFYGLFGYGFWWSATQSTVNNGVYIGLIYRGSFLLRKDISKEIGFSVRCVKN